MLTKHLSGLMLMSSTTRHKLIPGGVLDTGASLTKGQVASTRSYAYGQQSAPNCKVAWALSFKEG